MATSIKILRGEEELGPYTLEEAQEYLAYGALQPSDMAWCDGMAEWATITEVLNTLSNGQDSEDPNVNAQAQDPNVNGQAQDPNINGQSTDHLSPRQFRNLLEESAGEIRRFFED